MNANISRHQYRANAVIVLRRLLPAGSYISQAHQQAEKWGVLVARNQYARPVDWVDSGFARMLTDHGLLESDPLGRLTISSSGLSWLQTNGSGSQGGKSMPAARANGKRKPSAARTSTVTQQVRVNDGESPLAWLATRNDPDGRPILTQAMFDAGERLRNDFELGQMGARVTASWEASIASGASGRSGVSNSGLTASEAALAARQRVWKALQSAGPGLSSILLEVCCLASGLETAERHLKWPKRSAKLVLVLALDRLADHYGLVPKSRTSHACRSWGLTDYRPELLGHLSQPES